MNKFDRFGRTRAGVAVGAALVIASMLSACGGGSSGAQKASDALVIDGEQIAPANLVDAARKEGALTSYFNYPEAQWNQVLDQFTQDTGIQVNRVRATTGDLYPRVTAEAAGGKLGADIIDFGDPVLTADLANKKIIQKFTPPNASQIPADLRDKSGYSEVTELAPQVIAYNTAKVKANAAPKSFKDLLDPQWKGQIGMTPIVVGGSAFSVAYLQRSKLGEDYWSKLAAQNPKLYPSVSVLTPDMAKGQVSVGVTDLGVLTALAGQGAPLKAVFPTEGTPVFSETSMMSATTKKKDAALVYEAWMASKHGGSVIAKYMTVYPSNPKSSLPPALPGSVRKHLFQPTTQNWIDNVNSWTEDWKTIFHYSS